MRIAIYVRVSTDQQSTANQRQELERVASNRGWTIAGVYEDRGISGAKGRDKRPGFDRLQRDALRGAFDLVAAWSVDRLGRSLQDLVAFLGEIQAAGVGLYLHQQGVDTTTPAGRALFQMLGVFAEFERALIVERVRAGMQRAKREGKHLGRPALPESVRRIVEKHPTKSGREVAKLAGCSEAAVRRLRAAA
jgi:DNA invertase Pin-like site-specific DNA recombinase